MPTISLEIYLSLDRKMNFSLWFQALLKSLMAVAHSFIQKEEISVIGPYEPLPKINSRNRNQLNSQEIKPHSKQINKTKATVSYCKIPSFQRDLHFLSDPKKHTYEILYRSRKIWKLIWNYRASQIAIVIPNDKSIPGNYHDRFQTILQR